MGTADPSRVAPGTVSVTFPARSAPRAPHPLPFPWQAPLCPDPSLESGPPAMVVCKCRKVTPSLGADPAIPAPNPASRVYIAAGSTRADLGSEVPGVGSAAAWSGSGQAARQARVFGVVWVHGGRWGFSSTSLGMNVGFHAWAFRRTLSVCSCSRRFDYAMRFIWSGFG